MWYWLTSICLAWYPVILYRWPIDNTPSTIGLTGLWLKLCTIKSFLWLGGIRAYDLHPLHSCCSNSLNSFQMLSVCICVILYFETFPASSHDWLANISLLLQTLFKLLLLNASSWVAWECPGKGRSTFSLLANSVLQASRMSNRKKQVALYRIKIRGMSCNSGKCYIPRSVVCLKTFITKPTIFHH